MIDCLEKMMVNKERDKAQDTFAQAMKELAIDSYSQGRIDGLETVKEAIENGQRATGVEIVPCAIVIELIDALKAVLKDEG